MTTTKLLIAMTITAGTALAQNEPIVVPAATATGIGYFPALTESPVD